MSKKIIAIVLCFLLLGVNVPVVFSAWGTGGATCANQSESAASTLACTLATENLDAGNVAIVVCVGDNLVGAADGNSNTHSPVTDSGGNTYSKAYEWTRSGGVAADGVVVSLHYSKLTTGLTSGSSTITCNYGSSLTDRAMHLVDEFTITSGNVVSVVGSSQGEAVNTADAGSLTIGSLTSGEYLFVRAIGTESNAAISMTATTSYSLPGNPSDGCNNTTGGAESSDIGACSEYRIMGSSTGDTSNPTLVDTTNDNASVYVAFQEAAPPAVTGTGWDMGGGWQ